MPRQRHVCIVCCQHVPDDVRVTHKVGMSLRDAGFKVTWVGPLRPRRGNSYGIDFVYYAISPGRVARLLRCRDAYVAARSVRDVDVYYAPEPDSAVVAAALAKVTGARAVFDIHELYHTAMLTYWAKGWKAVVLSHTVKFGMRRIASQCDLVMGVNEPVLEPYRTVRTPIMVIRNCASSAFASASNWDASSPDRPAFTVVHGKTTVAHGTPTVLEATRIAAREVPELRVVMFDAFGLRPDGLARARFDAQVKAGSLAEHVELSPLVPLEEIPALLARADVGLFASDRVWASRSLPNRLFEYMAAGLPVIVPSYATEVADIVRKEGCGLLVDTEDPRAIAEAIVHLRRDHAEARAMGERGRRAFLDRHCWESEVKPFVAWVSGAEP